MPVDEIDFRWLDGSTILVAKAGSEPPEWKEIGVFGNIEFQNRLREEDRQRWIANRKRLV